MKYFAYNRAIGGEDFNLLIDNSLELARATYENKKPADYKEKNATLLAGIAKYALTGTMWSAQFENEGLAICILP